MRTLLSLIEPRTSHVNKLDLLLPLPFRQKQQQQ
jgi:hypothetical protein